MTIITETPGTRGHLTFRGNLTQTRYGWLRLTPAYSVHLVAELLDADRLASTDVALDPFCGTGTTALVCAERGIACRTTDINPFLTWLATAKTRSYTAEDIEAFHDAAHAVAAAATQRRASEWVPPLFQIEKWWRPAALSSLARMMHRLHELALSLPEHATDLLRVSFCRTLIEQSNVSFGHQSMSFKKSGEAVPLGLWHDEEERVIESWARSVSAISASARSVVRREPHVLLCDARAVDAVLPANGFASVITSPPYPNRMSYIRELRPYMYWLGYLQDARGAGELDWQAIGGTWGCATSYVSKWSPQTPLDVPFPGFMEIIARIDAHSPILSRYVHKYFLDMLGHFHALFPVVRPGGSIHYIVGNSKFYDVLLPVEEIYRSLLIAAGFAGIQVRLLRKRTSKRELFEYVVSGSKPMA